MAGFPTPEEVFEDRYRIVSIINRGGFGRVYRAQQVELNRDVAIKVLQPITRDGMDEHEEADRLEVVKKRFEREAQLVSQLRDSHTVVMHDYGTTRDGLLYMVLEYIDGQPLGDLVDAEGPLSPERVVRITKQVLWSLQEAHALNMLHRDIKPQNIMLFNHAGRVDQVKVLDFGLAKSAESADFRAEDPDLTGDQVILGTPRYMSPEQIRGEALNPSTDIYSLALVMYEMLTGHKAVTGESTMNTLARHLNDIPIELPADVDVPNRLRELVNRMLRKDATERMQTADEVLEALEFWNSPGSLFGEDAVAAPFIEEQRRRKFIWIAAAVAVAFLLMAIIISALSTDPPAPPEMADTIPDRTDRLQMPPQELVQVDGSEETGASDAPAQEAPPAEAKKEPAVQGEPTEIELPPQNLEEPDAQEEPAEDPAEEPGEASKESVERDVKTESTKEKKSTSTNNSGKNKKKVKLNIGILK